MEKQSRWSSPVLWAAIIALIGFILGNWGLYNALGLTNESFQQMCNYILGVLIAFGVINNPTDKKNV